MLTPGEIVQPRHQTTPLLNRRHHKARKLIQLTRHQLMTLHTTSPELPEINHPLRHNPTPHPPLNRPHSESMP
ncbi:hypothetical protein SVEN_0003 [Streptomyces venezuelae ATCC 10712]|uniref:Uncharacterized protein n=1 Tax=Streptomyces venezuelae (strain ATCC 10712 / CBS 650.69 / DSM 40230 / JCM 4526 / NBRC 13096 / PD 04745) TaxID=953739 RepID=F2R345_STRVP|nr:hypothetical protein SVEN_0003 [Streptomyces venezuelae ATCC 10712]